MRPSYIQESGLCMMETLTTDTDLVANSQPSNINITLSGFIGMNTAHE